jgi:hypothetical protein
MRVWKTIKHYTIRKINTVLEFISPVIHNRVKCKCQTHEHAHPCALQVKQKFGILRFYMRGGSPEMNELINEADRKSLTICEGCGNPGKIRQDTWISVLCDECDIIRNKKDEKWLT